jgi:hypothetical protein
MALIPVHDRAALERSMPLDPLRILKETRGATVIDRVEKLLSPGAGRQRAFRPADQLRWRNSLDMLLANLALAVFNRIDSERFVAVSFNTNDYIGTPHSSILLARIRDGLAQLGLIEGQRGYRHARDGVVRHARRTRLRATAELRALFADCGITRGDIGWSERRDIIILRQVDPHAADEPAEVTASREVLIAQNARLAKAEIALPADGWSRVAARYFANEEDPEERLVAGEEATQLYRIFKGDWQGGGRLYGGWWINLPKVERQLLTINGEPVVERDYARLHPTLLFARCGQALDHDIYTVAGFTGSEVRELGKRTFNRLINRTSASPLRLAATGLDRAQLPPGARFSDYVTALTAQLGPVAKWFGSGEGLRLQREDSDLALAVLARLLAADVLALPVHDSFIVARRHADQLLDAMRRAFSDRYGFAPEIR